MSEYRGTTGKHIFIVVFLLIQLLLPIRGFVFDKLETRGIFSWNMYATRYKCWARYTLYRPDGVKQKIHHWKFFKRRSRWPLTFHRDVLPEFHQFLCDTYRNRGELGTIEGRAGCSLNHGPRSRLIIPHIDICTAPNYGVPAE